MDFSKLSKILNFNIATLTMKHYTYKKDPIIKKNKKIMVND